MSDRDNLAALIRAWLMDARSIEHGRGYDDPPYVDILKHGSSTDDDPRVMPDKLADAILAAGWRAPTVSCAPDEHILYESCGICGDIPEEISEQWDAGQ